MPSVEREWTYFRLFRLALREIQCVASKAYAFFIPDDVGRVVMQCLFVLYTHRYVRLASFPTKHVDEYRLVSLRHGYRQLAADTKLPENSIFLSYRVNDDKDSKTGLHDEAQLIVCLLATHHTDRLTFAYYSDKLNSFRFCYSECGFIRKT